MTEPPHDNTYIFDPESPTEMARLTNQDHVLTMGMGGIFSGLTDNDIAGLQNVADLGCGPGSWVLDVAFANAEIEVAGSAMPSRLMDKPLVSPIYSLVCCVRQDIKKSNCLGMRWISLRILKIGLSVIAMRRMRITKLYHCL